MKRHSPLYSDWACAFWLADAYDNAWWRVDPMELERVLRCAARQIRENRHR